MSTKDFTFVQALQEQLDQRGVTESPFGSVPTPSDLPLPPGSFPTPQADVILNPRLAETMMRDREAQMRRVAHRPSRTHEFKYDVFIVHRPPGACFECKLKTKAVFDERAEAIANKMDPDDVEPEFDFQNCSHNRRDAYVALMNRAVREEITIGSHREETLASGVVQVCVSWGEPIRPVKG